MDPTTWLDRVALTLCYGSEAFSLYLFGRVISILSSIEMLR